MTTVAEILKSKPQAAVYSVAPQDSVFQALRPEPPKARWFACGLLFWDGSFGPQSSME